MSRAGSAHLADPDVSASEASRQRTAAFALGFAIGAALGYKLVERPRSERACAACGRSSPVSLPQQAPVWRERSDVFRPGPAEAIAPSSSRWRGVRDQMIGISREAMAAMERHVRSDLRREQVGLLFGRVTAREDGAGSTTHVDCAIPIGTSNASATHVVLTHESAGDVAQALSAMPSGATVVGWFHSHPGLGVFLSGTDLRTQRDCFGADWQVAVVLDPQRSEMGVFAGPDGAAAQPQTAG